MHEHSAETGAPALLPWLLLASILCFYLLAAVREQRRPAGWRAGRSLAFAAGILLLGAAWASPLASLTHQDLRAHMVQHLLIGMLAPLGLVSGAPLTLALRALPARFSQPAARFLGSRALRPLSHPFSALFFNLGGMYLLYLTPLFAASLEAPWLHSLILAHFLLAGSLFTWAVLSPPGVRSRVPAQTRLAALLLSTGAHAVLGKLMYAYALPRTALFGAEQVRAAAQIMYYGGDLAEILLAVLFFGLWYRDRARRSQGRPPSQARPAEVMLDPW